MAGRLSILMPTDKPSPTPHSDSDANVHVRIRDVHKSYGEHHILRGISFDILRAKTNMIIGPSGTGKSVLMRQLIRLETPDSGEICVDGTDIAQLDEVALIPIRRQFGMVFQMSALFDSMTVFDNVAFPLREHLKLSTKDLRERVMQRLTDLGVDHAAHKMPSDISGGMQKRVAIARALALESKILIYDEPTTGLDPITSRAVDALIGETQDKFGVTSIVISHDMASVFRIADQIHFLHGGKVEVSGTPQMFLDQSSGSVLSFLEASGVTVDTMRNESKTAD